MNNLEYELNLSKVSDNSQAEYEYSIKSMTYPKIPKQFNIQKRMLDCDSRKKEINLIDRILDLNIDFKIFIFDALKSSFSQLDKDVANVFLVNKYFQESGMYYQCEFLLKKKINSSRFNYFIKRYLDYKNYQLSLPLNVMVNYQFYNSMLWIHNLSSRILGIKEIWNLIDSYAS